MAQVIDDHAEPVRPVAVPIADGQVAGRGDVVPTRPDDPIHPSLTTTAERRPQHGPVEFALAAGGRAARP